MSETPQQFTERANALLKQAQVLLTLEEFMAKKPVLHDAPGMRGERSRNASGQLRKLRSDETLASFEETYNIDTGRRSDMQVGNLMKEHGVDNVKDLLDALREAK